MMGPVWERRTEVVDAAHLPPDVTATIERRAAERGIPWSLGDQRHARLAWATTSTTQAGRLRKRTRTVVTVGVVGDEVLAWTVSDDGGPPAALVVRRDRVDIADGHLGLAGIAPEVLARAGALDTEGVTVRGDLGGRDLASAFIGLGTGPAAERVRDALLGSN
jgi:hypothetical protein